MISELTTVIDNKNPFMFIYSGHGGNSLLGAPYVLTYSDISDSVLSNRILNNEYLRIQPFGFAMACLTNDYSYNNNFARGFTSASMNGGVTFPDYCQRYYYRICNIRYKNSVYNNKGLNG